MDARLRRVIGAVAATLVLLVGAPAVAEVPPEAIELMTEGAEQYQAGDYDRAAVTFRRAFEVHPDARFLFNAARASQRGDNPRQAYNYYQRALEVDGQERRLDAGDQAVAVGFVHGIDQKQTGVAVADDIGEGANVASGMAEVESESALDEVSWGTSGRTGIGMASLGGVLMVASGVLAWRSSTRIGTLENQRVETFEGYQREVEGIERNQRWGRWSLYGGLALVASGTVLVGWGLMRVNDGLVGNLHLAIAGDGVQAVWEVRFE